MPHTSYFQKIYLEGFLITYKILNMRQYLFWQKDDCHSRYGSFCFLDSLIQDIKDTSVKWSMVLKDKTKLLDKVELRSHNYNAQKFDNQLSALIYSVWITIFIKLIIPWWQGLNLVKYDGLQQWSQKWFVGLHSIFSPWFFSFLSSFSF